MSNPKKKGTGVKLWTTLTIVTAILLVASIIGSYVAFTSAQAINIALKIDLFETVNEDKSAIYFASDFDSVEALEAHDRQVAEQLHAEGAVLLMNNDALPLTTSEKISAFGHNSVNIAGCGTGSADIDISAGPNLKEALEAEGFTVNPTLWSFYEDNAANYPSIPTKGMGGVTGYDRSLFHVNEIPADVYTEAVKSSYATYGDVALVVITRLSGELYDVPADGFVDGTNNLDLTDEEKDMLKMIEAAGFKKTVVLINSTNAFECEFLYDEAYGIDAALWIGYTGTWGLNGVADLLSGAANPSGRLVDTYCFDNTTNPAMVGFYGSYYANYDAADTANWYKAPQGLDGNGYTYQEGIYVGYRYYETRYEDVVMGTGNAGSYNYASEVAFPFGYGLSYTTFDWSGYSVSYDAATDSFTVKVTVTNTGDVAGKEVVEVYFQSPYTEYDKSNGIEKAAIELCGFAKTEILAPGASETVEVIVPRNELACYDAKGYGTYILDAGDYYLTAGKNAHDALNNVLAAKGYTTANGMTAAGNADLAYLYNVAALDATTYSISAATGNAITNQFENTDLSYYGLDDLTYLSRSDWQGTWPKEVSLTANEAMLVDLNRYHSYNGTEGSTAKMPTMGADNDMTLGMMIGKDFDDPDWENLLDQVTFEEMATLIGQGYHNTAMMVSVSKPATLDDNGPQGFTQALTGVKTCHCAYSDENIMAATWNTDLMYEVGRCIGNDMLDLGAVGLYGPAMNIHRTAYSGRNFEYYSEDGFLSGKIAAAEVKGIQDKGCYVYIKHFALNDSETNCRCVSTWVNEQTIREIYLKPFQMAIEEGGAMNVMNAFSRFGAVWSGGHYGLMTNVLRGEWGMRGFGLTDFSGNSAFAAYGITLKSFDVVQGVLAGTDSWDSSAVQWTNDLLNLYQNDPDVAQAMRLATHRVLYTVANSHAMNGFTADTEIVAVTPWWQTALIALCVVMGVLTVLCIWKLTGAVKKSKAAKHN